MLLLFSFFFPFLHSTFYIFSVCVCVWARGKGISPAESEENCIIFFFQLLKELKKPSLVPVAREDYISIFATSYCFTTIKICFTLKSLNFLTLLSAVRLHCAVFHWEEITKQIHTLLRKERIGKGREKRKINRY